MDKYSIFFCFFLNLIVRRCTAEVTKIAPFNRTYQTELIEGVDFVNSALKLIGIENPKGVNDTSIDWKKSFIKLAPICINAINNAATYEFMLVARNHILFVEDNFPEGLPENVDEFVKQIRTDARFANITDETLKGEKHFRTWLWMLARPHKKIFRQMDRLRNLLNNDVQQFIWFGNQIRRFFEIFSDDPEAVQFSPVHDVKNMKVYNIEKYLAMLNPDIRDGLRFYSKSEGWMDEDCAE